MDTLVKIVMGSRLYGTNTPDSDWDYQSIHWATLDMLSSGKIVYDEDRSTNKKTKNSKDDVDIKSKELRAFVRDVLTGQTYALDMIHAPRDKIIHTSETWEELLSLKDKLVTNKISSFIGYCLTMAEKFSAKGAKLTELVTIIDRLKTVDSGRPIADAIAGLDFSQFQYLKLETKTLRDGQKEDYLLIPFGAFPVNRKISQSLGPIQMRLGIFGGRSQEAAKSGGLDLKAYYHAFRVAWQLEDYITTGQLVFPSAKVSQLLDIRKGIYTKDHLDEWIDSELQRILSIPINLPEPDFEFWDNWVSSKYRSYMKCAVARLEGTENEIPSIGIEPIVLSS